MPKVKWLKTPENEPKANYLAALLNAYKKAKGLTCEEIAKRMGKSPEHVRHTMTRPVDEWRIGQLKEYCKLLDVPIEEALEAAAR